MTETDDPVGTFSTQAPPPLRELGDFVHRKVSVLQRQQLAREARARATLARLRRAVNREPGSDPNVWEFTLGGLPLPTDSIPEAPVPSEYAAHIAMTLYAVHQQSRTVGMHKRGVGLGTALRRLTKGKNDDVAVTRRFQALSTAQETSEITYHARGLISQLRAASIPLDYGLFADQLLKLQDPRWAAEVRLQWGREFHRAWDSEENSDTDNDQPNGDLS